MSISTTNPYLNHAHFSPLEADVLWEYAKLSDKVKRIANLARLTAEKPNEGLLAEMRELEKKIGLVLTLFKASVFGVLETAKMAKEEAAFEQQREREEQATYQEDRTWAEEDSLEY
ncbi:DASH complex subunit DAD3, partial [Tremellales sp. Uapishka_1]